MFSREKDLDKVRRRMRKRKANKLIVRENLKKKWIARKRNRAIEWLYMQPKKWRKRKKETN